jgi:hypothetical protein
LKMRGGTKGRAAMIETHDAGSRIAPLPVPQACPATLEEMPDEPAEMTHERSE